MQKERQDQNQRLNPRPKRKEAIGLPGLMEVKQGKNSQLRCYDLKVIPLTSEMQKMPKPTTSRRSIKAGPIAQRQSES
jgi:hypothetical protein